jgi:hypothetical protein
MSQNKSRPESESMPVRRTRFSSGTYFGTKGVVTTEYLTAFSGRDPTKMRKLMVSFTKVLRNGNALLRASGRMPLRRTGDVAPSYPHNLLLSSLVKNQTRTSLSLILLVFISPVTPLLSRSSSRELEPSLHPWSSGQI